MSIRQLLGTAEDRARQVVVFDLDGTLVAGDSFGSFMRHLITRHPLRCGLALFTAPVWAPTRPLPPTRLAAERYLVWLAAAGMDEETFAAAARDFATRHAGVDGGRTATAALARVRQHVVAGDRVLVATGCAAPLAQGICGVIGLDELEVVASTIVRRRWGLPRQLVPARGAGKLRALTAAGVQLPVDHAYSDSFADLPLLRAARTAHVVDPSARDLVRLRRELGADVDVLRWATPTRRPAPGRGSRSRGRSVLGSARGSCRNADQEGRALSFTWTWSQILLAVVRRPGRGSRGPHDDDAVVDGR